VKNQLRIENSWAVLEVLLPGKPKGKDRPRSGQGRIYTPEATSAAEEAIRWDLKAAGAKPFIGVDVHVELMFFLPDRRAVDMDNLEKLVLDACNGFAYHDDSQVVEKHTWLYRGTARPRTELTIRYPIPAGGLVW
jgi:crossover junction endodeoxyribonuclease RusA